MSRTMEWTSSAWALALAAMWPLAGAQAAAAAPAENNVAATDGEIVVTATKRSTKLEETPLAVSALTGEALKAKGADSLVNYARSVPGLSFTDIGAGRQRLSIRGVDSKIGFPVVGYYLGESPIPGSRGTIAQTVVDPRLFDIDRIEVLRGPQGTLYGSGSMGGTVRVIPRRPDMDSFGGEVQGTATSTKAAGQALGYGLNAVVNLPIVTDRVALRVAAWRRSEDGFVERQVQGVTVKRQVPRESTYGVRGTLDIRVAPGWTLSTSAFYQRQGFNGFQDITTGAINPNDRLVQNFGFDVAEKNVNRFQLYNALVEGDLGFAKLLSSSSYFDGVQFAQEETSAVLDYFFGVAAGDPIRERNRNKDFTQEIRLTSSRAVAGFDYMLGGYYNRNRGSRRIDYTIPGFSNAFFPVAGDNLFSGLGDYHARQVALFGELSRKLGPVTVTAGLRWFDARNSSQEPQNGLFAGVESATPPVLSDAPRLAGKSDGVIKKLNVSWQVAPSQLVYVQAAQGFRPGLGQSPLPASLCGADLAALGLSTAPRQLNADKLWNYEAGVKSGLFDRKLQINLSAYRIDWKAIQQSVFLQCGFRVYVNGPDVRNQGVEADVSLKLSRAARVGGTVSYVSSKFRDPLLGLPGTEGHPLPDIPRWSASAFAELAGPLSGEWNWSGRLDFSHTAGSVSVYQAGGSNAKDKGPLDLLDARLGFERDRVSLALFARNLLNDVERTALEDSLSANVPSRLRYAVNRPRTFGVEAGFKF